MSYQVGQAVMDEFKNLAFVKKQSEYKIDVINIAGHNHWFHPKDTRPSTEAEILAEAVKHGWNNKAGDTWFNSPSKKVSITESFNKTKWDIVHSSNVEDYYAFGQECITAHRLITALNLVK